MPPLTTTPVQADAGVSTSSLGEFRRADGTHQLTFDGKPLYLYLGEVPQIDPSTGNPLNPASITTGNGLAGPGHHGKFGVVTAAT